MQMELRWIAGLAASCVHAVAAVQKGLPCADDALITALRPSIDCLRAELAASPFSADVFLSHLLPLSAVPQSAEQLTQLALTKTQGAGDQGQTVTRLAGALKDVVQAFRQAHPDIIEQLELRSSVLHGQWEARGPGLLSAIGRIADESLLVPCADVVLVHPVLGGGGTAHVLYNQVTIEAVLANPHADLPEVVRLAWLLSQLHMELPKHSETIPGSRLPRLAALAMMPVTLRASESVELACLSKEMLFRACDVWQLNCAERPSTAEVVWQWWEVYEGSRPAWQVALAALDRMVGDS